MYKTKISLRSVLSFLICLLLWQSLYAQGDIEIPLNEPFGDPDWNFKGRMNGNRVFETFWNHGEIGFWNIAGRANWDDSDWPAGGEINPYLDGIAVIVGGSVVDTLGNRVHITSSNYREEVDRSPDLETIWGWHPIPGYLNFDRINAQTGARNPIPAMSNDPSSWPPAGWPDQPDYFDAAGNVEWNGRFGRGKFNAQLEAYYVVDDALDHEFGYVPDPADPDRGGLGLRMNVRLYQWVHPLAQDVLFAEFGITNLGVAAIDSTAFGWWTDNGIGGTGSDNGLFARAEGAVVRDFDLAIGFDPPDAATDISGLPTGLAGYAFLESPGISDDFEDNDDDGIVDEKRDNDAGVFIDGPGNVDAAKFQAFYDREPGPHWEGDEDQDWTPFEDLNENGSYDFGEAINDDLGSDGVGPGELNYTGPDADGTEVNMQPDQGEPNFGRTDNDESDQLGMTFFEMIPVPDHPNPRPNRFQPSWFSDDETWWEWLTTDSIFATPATEENLVMIFASGVFPLEAKRTERFSMVLARSFGSESNLEQMIELKETVQAIFNTDYQFAQPPIKPTLTAVPKDGEVLLIWDKISLESQDPFLKNANDFSGYRIYKSTDPLFSDITVITDEKGTPTIRKPLKIFDLEDGYKGPHPINVAGAPYDMGSESGLEYRFVDTDVINGLTYYYAVTAFDTGAPTKALSPTENTAIIEVNFLGEALFSDRNTAIVTPKSPAVGYNPPAVVGSLDKVTEGFGTGRILGFEEPNGSQIIDPDNILADVEYRLSFVSEQVRNQREVITTNYSVTKIDNGEDVVLVDNLPWVEDSLGLVITDVFEGIILAIQNDSVSYDSTNTGWLTGEEEVSKTSKGWVVNVRPDTGVSGATHVMPHSDIELKFLGADTIIAPAGRGAGARKFLSNLPINITAIAADTAILNVSVIDVDSSDAFELENDALEIWEKISIRNRTYWYVTFRPEAGGSPSTLGDGDNVMIKTNANFANGDYFDFTTREAFIDQDEAKQALADNKVAVVPNPYIFTNPLEPADPFRLGQESRLMFINVPAQATIRIFTLSGKLVDRIEVTNEPANGTVVWDLRSSEDLRIAPGIYIFHIKDNTTNEEQLGRFVIIR